VIAAEDVERQIAVVPVVAVEESPFLLAVHRIVGRIQVQDDLGRRHGVSLYKKLDPEPVHRLLIECDLLVAFLFLDHGLGQLQTVQRALARQGFAPIPLARTGLARRIGLLGQHRQQRIGAQLVVVVQVFVAQRQPINPLRHQFSNRVLHLLWDPMVSKAGREALDDPRPLLHLAQQQPARVRGHRSPVKPAYHLALIQRMKFEGFLATLCPQKAVLLLRQKSFSQKYLCQKATAFFNFSVRNPG